MKYENRNIQWVLIICLLFIFSLPVFSETPESVTVFNYDTGEDATYYLGADYDITITELTEGLGNALELPVGTRILINEEYDSYIIDSYDIALDEQYATGEDPIFPAYYYSELYNIYQGCIVTLPPSYQSNAKRVGNDVSDITLPDENGDNGPLIETIGSWMVTRWTPTDGFGTLEIYPKERPSSIRYSASASTNLENDVTVSLNQETEIPANATIYLTINPNGQTLDYNTLLQYTNIEKLTGPTYKNGKVIFTFKKATENNLPVSITLEATSHTHNFEYTVGTGGNANTLTATCIEDGCELPSNSTTLTVTSTQTVSTVLAAFNTATGLSATAGSLQFNENSTIPTTPGLYTQTVAITVEAGKTYNLTFPRKLLVLSEDADNSDALTSAANETAVDVRIARTFKTGYNTLCLPFALSASEISSVLSGANISKPTSSGASKAGNITKMSTEAATAISAGGVYIVHFASTPANWAIANTLFENKVITASVTPVTLTDTNTTVKTTYSVLSDSNKLTPGNKKQLFIKDGGNGFTYPKTADDTKLKGFRAWFERE